MECLFHSLYHVPGTCSSYDCLIMIAVWFTHKHFTQEYVMER